MAIDTLCSGYYTLSYLNNSRENKKNRWEKIKYQILVD